MTAAYWQRLFGALVDRHLRDGDWGLVAVAAVETLPVGLQTALARTFAVAPGALLLLVEPGGERPPA